MTISYDALWLVFFVVIRLSGVMLIAPAFSSSTVNVKTRLGLLLVLGICLSTTLPRPHYANMGLDKVFPAVLGEFSAGLLLGVGYHTAMSAAAMAGELVGLQMGLGSGVLLDPASGNNGSILDTFFMAAFTVLFVTLDGPHHILRIVAESFQTVPAGSASGGFPPISVLIEDCALMLSFGCRLAAPVLIPLLLLTVAMALISRAFPQANILSLSYGLSMMLGFILLAASVPALQPAFQDMLRHADRSAIRLVDTLHGQ